MVYSNYKNNTCDNFKNKESEVDENNKSAGTITYQSTMGGNITIPGVSVDKIKR